MAPASTLPAPVSAYIPCYNNAATLAAAIAGIQRQSVKVDELFVVDDCSTDNSREVAAGLGIRVVEMKVNGGRGAVRARAMKEAQHDLVLCCDATNRLEDHFLQGMLRWFENPKVAAVSGRLKDLNITGALGRWRARHLFYQDENWTEPRRDTLSTWGTLMRKSAVMEVGNFDPKLRFCEDRELGGRLKDAGYTIYFDPRLTVASQAQNTLGQVMERFFRWHWEGLERVSFNDFVRAQVNAIKILAVQDLKAGDPAAALISLLTPYYRVLYYHPPLSWSVWRKLTTRPVWWLERKRSYPIRSEWSCLPPIRADQGNVPFVILAQPQDFDDVLWCAWSWLRFIAPEVRLEIHVDGPVGEREQQVVEKLFPGGAVIDTRYIAAEAGRSYPVLEDFFTHYPIGRKMALLFHLQQATPVVYCDFDVLAFALPVEIIECLKKAGAGAYLQESGNGSYDPVMLQKAKALGMTPLDSFNAGLLVLQKGSLSLAAANALLQGWRDCPTWWVEQTVLACLLRMEPMIPLPRERYVLSNQRQFYWQEDVADYRQIAARHFTTPTRHVMYLKGLPLLKDDALKKAT